MASKKAFVTGITGQDGYYLAKLLLNVGYEVHALVRTQNTDSVVDINTHVFVHEGSLTDFDRVSEIIREVQPDEIYNLAAQSSVARSFEHPDETWKLNYDAVGNLVNEALGSNPYVRIYQASTSEMFGNSPAPQSELTPFNPQSPYAASKAKAHEDFIIAKRATGAYAVSGILFNHESPRRGKHYVTRKITSSLVRISDGLQDTLELGNLNAVRDWGHAADYVQAMYLMLQQNIPEDYVISSGTAHSVREFVEIAAAYLGIVVVWEGEGVHEVGRNKMTGAIVVKVNPAFYRPLEVNFTQGDSRKAHTKLGWRPKHSFGDIVEEMVLFDIEMAKNTRT